MAAQKKSNFAIHIILKKFKLLATSYFDPSSSLVPCLIPFRLAAAHRYTDLTFFSTLIL
jgi:hypothetical protein